ncbi:MAG: hypothetical protein ABW133_00705 [Polyangiaceae bacterium]
MTTNLVILIHGMTPLPGPMTQDACYDALWTALTDLRPELGRRIAGPPIKVEWGHERPGEPAPVRADHQLTLAEQFILDRVGYANVERVSDPGNRLQTDIGIPGVHWALGKIRESVILFGLADVVYYCSRDGETRVRQQVYEQVLSRLQPYVDKGPVRLHLFAHSLGVAIAHDFLYGLFNRDPDYCPGFVKEKQGSSEEAEQRFLRWRKKAQAGELSLGGFAAAASQLPLLLMRSQKIVTTFYDAKRASNAGQKPIGVDPRDIGIAQSARPQWTIFYDTDDLLGFPSRGLYTLPDGSAHPAIVDCQVNTGWEPMSAHLRYWQHTKVIEETARLFASWTE